VTLRGYSALDRPVGRGEHPLHEGNMSLRVASALAVLLLVAPLETFAGSTGGSAAKSAKGFTEAEAQKWVKGLETKPTPSKGPRN
jgi:hypothetical protein